MKNEYDNRQQWRGWEDIRVGSIRWQDAFSIWEASTKTERSRKLGRLFWLKFLIKKLVRLDTWGHEH